MLVRPQAADVLFLAQGYLGDGHSAEGLQGLLQQVGGLDADSLRFEDVGTLEVHGVDGGQVDELGDLYGVRGADGKIFEVAVVYYRGDDCFHVVGLVWGVGHDL